MTTIASNVLWGSGPKVYFDFSYEKKREGSAQYYNISVSCDALTGTHYFGYPIYLEIFLDGTKKATKTLKNASPNQWSSAIAYSTGWLEVSNKTSGTTALKIRVYSGSGSTRDTTYGYSLAVDPSASQISCTTTNIGSKPTITISSASSSFTHTVEYWFGTLKGTIVTKTPATSITSWTIPEEFYTQIPDAKIGEGKLICTTYSGGTPVGDPTECKMLVTTDETICKPTVDGAVIDINPITIDVTGDPHILVKFCSTAFCVINVTLNKNAGSVLSKTISNIAVADKSLTIPNVETGTFDFYAKDSRTYFNTDKVVKTLIPYVKLTNDAEIQRTAPTSGNATLWIRGNYFNGNFGASDNTLEVKYRQGDSGEYTIVTPTIADNEYSAIVSLTDLDYTKSFSYEVVVSDKLSSVTKKLTLQKGIPIFDWGENDFNFNVPVTISGVPIADFVMSQGSMAAVIEAQGSMADFVVEQGSSDGWAYRKWNSGIAECWRYYQYLPTATGDQAFSVSYPFSFVSGDYPIVTTTLGMNGTLANSALACDAVGNLPNRETACNLFLRGITSKSYMIAVHIHVLGRWR